MINVVVGGQMDKQVIASFLQKRYPDQLSIKITSDIDGALAIKSGTADYYVGACATGAGGALGMAVGFLGPAYTVSLSYPGKIASDEDIQKHVADGKKAFGMVNNDFEKVLPVLFDAILALSKEGNS